MFADFFSIILCSYLGVEWLSHIKIFVRLYVELMVFVWHFGGDSWFKDFVKWVYCLCLVRENFCSFLMLMGHTFFVSSYILFIICCWKVYIWLLECANSRNQILPLFSVLFHFDFSLVCLFWDVAVWLFSNFL